MLRVFTVDRDDKDKRALLSLQSFYARFSLDGKKIAYIQDASAAGHAIVIADGKGSVLTTIALDAVGRGTAH